MEFTKLIKNQDQDELISLLLQDPGLLCMCNTHPIFAANLSCLVAHYTQNNIKKLQYNACMCHVPKMMQTKLLEVKLAHTSWFMQTTVRRTCTLGVLQTYVLVLYFCMQYRCFLVFSSLSRYSLLAPWKYYFKNIFYFLPFMGLKYCTQAGNSVAKLSFLHYIFF